jgi:hypothetical protein
MTYRTYRWEQCVLRRWIDTNSLVDEMWLFTSCRLQTLAYYRCNELRRKFQFMLLLSLLMRLLACLLQLILTDPCYKVPIVS